MLFRSRPFLYKWTEWFFIQLYKKGLAYRKKSPVDFCPNCNTTLAREQVWGDDRHCERCGTPVIKKDLSQWFFKTTQYADELLHYEEIDWPERVKTLQTNWIGKLRPVADEVGRARRIDDARGRYIVFLKNTFPQKFTLDAKYRSRRLPSISSKTKMGKSA